MSTPRINPVALLLLAYPVGLLLAGLPGFESLWSGASLSVLLGGAIAAWVVPRLWPTGPRPLLWLALGLIPWLALVYFQWRLPQPGPQDISQFVVGPGSAPNQLVEVRGTIADSPRLTRSHRVRFLLRCHRVRFLEPAPPASAPALDSVAASAGDAAPDRAVTGSLYVTVPLLQGTGLQPGQALTLSGNLYRPRSPSNPGGFDFRAYLQRQGTFAGLAAWRVRAAPSTSGWTGLGWSLRQRIVQAHAWGLTSPAAPLLSAMALGRTAVDLPFEIQDAFARIGLAHTIAASGFHVSLVVGVVLALARRASPRLQFGLGLGVLLLFLALTGAQPSIVRAVIMGSVALGGLAWNQTVKPLGLLLMSAIGMLLVQPLWIQDLGFQLSFLATFGLLVTAQPLAQACDRLPPTIANALAVPLAATLWTLPLQLFHFGLFSPYTILVNLLALPWVYLLSLGGILSAAVAALWPPAGTALAALLQVPTQSFLALVQGFNQLPGATIAVGHLALTQVVLLYGLLVVWWLTTPKGRGRVVLLVLLLALALVPGWSERSTWDQITILHGDRLPVAVVQYRGQVGVINAGSGDRVNYNLLPFLRQQGVNRLDWAISTLRSLDAYDAWGQLLADLPVTQFVDAVPPPPALAAASGQPPDSPPNPGNPDPLASPASPQRSARPDPRTSAAHASDPATIDPATIDRQQQHWLQAALQASLTPHRGTYQPLADRPLALTPLTLNPLRPAYPTDPSLAAAPGHAWIWTWANQTWVVLLDLPIDRQNSLIAAINALNLSPAPWLWWHGSDSPSQLSRDLVTQVAWQGAIVTGFSTHDPSLGWFRDQNIPVYGGDQPGAIRWDPTTGATPIAPAPYGEGEPSP